MAGGSKKTGQQTNRVRGGGLRRAALVIKRTQPLSLP
jgi:hypothetical protein